MAHGEAIKTLDHALSECRSRLAEATAVRNEALRSHVAAVANHDQIIATLGTREAGLADAIIVLTAPEQQATEPVRRGPGRPRKAT